MFQTIGTKPIAHIDQFTAEMLGSAELIEEVSLDGSGKLVKVGARHADLRTALILHIIHNSLVLNSAVE